MKKLIFLFSFILLLTNVQLQASECYHYHIIRHYNLVRLAGKNYLQLTVKDPDNITYVSQERYLITNVHESLTVVYEDDQSMLVKNDQFYYLLSKEIPYQQPVTLKKLYAVSALVQVKNNRLIRSGGKWRYIVPNNDAKRGFEEVLLDKLPADFEILYSFNRDNGANYLIKSKKQVAAVNINIEYKHNTYTYNPITNLNPRTTVFTAAADEVDNHFLRDDRHFYLINYDLNLTDVTNQFVSEKKIGFNKMHISLNSFHEPVWSDGSNTLWIYFKDGISLSDGTDPNFFPIEGEFLNTDSVIIVHNGKYYANGWGAAYEVEDLDLSLVRDKTGLAVLNEGSFVDKYQYYRIENNRLLPNETLPVPNFTQKFPVIASYGAYTAALQVSSNVIIREESTDSISHKSVVKSLVKAYAFDDKLLIENQLIENPGNREKMVFIGALADVIVPCDGGRGQHPVVVEYDYFFKDDKAIYAYHSKQKNLKILKDFKPDEITIDHFDDIQKLARLVNK
ncbi:hypothetical protein LZQ00_03075 [Sphingobacterium sp. SRCM116780]|uniref:hypothetical protein n=1 Tax=Sphingobacterium sp. SRCM116780 TaxID=2907623 RepID=UPI001F391A91|nr:hypothetical protein [Sphingobacterium sp. SRCM116780]UIR56807.1 hypothetical protein LZQ00_03075 [Sphingobacterium sp. SRCM116780]